ncbi:MAG: quinol dehydrogenase membrane component [Candidatus Hydrogenedentes bacterium ADurb.Bin179]|nr:MAG: quinol dehydrogenase membrane component [Candidatus Hydrogenedentes bacterium ADurb.Bin179]
MKRIRGFLPLMGLGFFSLVAQSLLFRDVIAVFEYSEPGIAVFYASWLLWIALGAYAGRRDSSWTVAFGAWFAPAVLLYIPAFLLQHFLVLHARSLAGIEPYVVFPLMRMFVLLFLVNAPVSLLTGVLFPVGCRWAEKDAGLPAARVYTFETLGACMGGLFVTAMLIGHASGQTVFVWACFAAAASLPFNAGFGRGSGRARLRWIPVVVLLILTGADNVPGRLGRCWTQMEDRAAWARLLPTDTYGGSLSTARGRYLYGEREGQFLVLSGGGVCESFPGSDRAAAVAALHLAQHPAARDILVFGEDTLGISARFCALPGVARVTWMHPDPEYPEKLRCLLANKFPDKIEVIGQDLRLFVQNARQRVDLVVLNLPEITTLTVNRYCTREFFEQLSGILSDTGVIGVRVSGGANYVGAELADPGAMMLATLRHQFRNIVIKPGDETWLIVSNGDGLSQSPETLRERYSAIAGAQTLYPPEGVAMLYPPDRVAFQLDAYENTLAASARDEFLNTDSHPKALQHGLYLSFKQAEWRAFARALRHLLRAGLWLFAAPIVLYGMLRCLYLLKSRGRGRSLFDCHVVVTSTGLASMAFNIVLMFIYQARFGSLFLDIGLITALFMLGSSAGCACVSRLLQRYRGLSPRRLMGVFLTVQVLILLAIAPLPEWSRPVWLALFLWGGIFTGIYVPLVAAQSAAAGIAAPRAGAHLELSDTLGGALGALSTGLLLLPLLGAKGTVTLLAALVAVNLAPLLLPARNTITAGDWFDRLRRSCGYILAGIAVYALLVSQLADRARQAQENQSIEVSARAFTGSRVLRKETAHRADGAATEYLAVLPDTDTPGGYVFDSADWSPRVYGYGGPLRLLVYMAPDGSLRDYDLFQHNETPAYLEMAQGGKLQLLGRSLFSPVPFEDVDAVSGATVTSNAIMRALEQAGHGFAVNALHKEITGMKQIPPAPSGIENTGLRDFLLLSLLLMAAVALRLRPSLWRRRLLLCTSLVVAGFLLNLQFSTQQVLTLTAMNFGRASFTGAFFVLAIVPLAVLLLGNVYCGYLCPFGALQELAGDLVAGGRHIPDKSTWRYGRAVKYLFLFALLILYACTRDASVLRGDILITLFGGARERAVLAVAVLAVALSVLSPRFWCRTLCPAGAFLSLCSGVSLLRRWMPKPLPRHCHLGVMTPADLDCIHCDRCVLRHNDAKPSVPEPRNAYWLNALFPLAVVLMFLSVLFMSVSSAGIFLTDMGAPAVTDGVGKPREVDVDLFKRLIQEGALSEREADFYIKK